MEVLAKEGHVFMTGTVTVRGRRGSPQRIVHVEPAAENHAVSVQNYLSLVESRVAAKSNVVYGPSHTLLVAIDDYHPMIEEDDWSQLAKNAEAWLARYPLDFARVAFVGVSGRHFLTRDV